jgi:ribosomal protein S18 acetylase RimI-like enzyme
MDQRERIARFVPAAWRARVAVCGGEVHEVDGLVVCLTGVPIAAFNPTLVGGRVGDPAAALAIAEALYPPGIGFGIELLPSLHGEVRLAALAGGLQLIDTEPVMTVPPREVADTPSPRGLSLQRVTDPGMLDEVARVDAASFGGEADVTRGFMPDAMLDDPAHRVYLGILDGEVVAAAETSLAGRVLGVFGVATVPEARRRGIGAAITAHVVADRRDDADLAVLESSEMGEGVYGRLGFRTIMTREVWARPEPS